MVLFIIILIIAFIVIAAIAVFLNTAKVKLTLVCVYSNKERYAYMSAVLFGIHIMEREIELEENEEHEENMLQFWKSAFRQLADRKELAQKINVIKFSWKTCFGAGDAALTGMAAGGLWGIKGFVYNQLSRFCKVENKPEYAITPDFQSAVFDSRLCCIGTITVGQAIRKYVQTPSKRNK